MKKVKCQKLSMRRLSETFLGVKVINLEFSFGESVIRLDIMIMGTILSYAVRLMKMAMLVR